jgi:hypothetical protein
MINRHVKGKGHKQPAVDIEWGMIKLNKKVFRTATITLYDYNRNKDVRVIVGTTRLQKEILNNLGNTNDSRIFKLFEEVKYFLPEDKLTPDTDPLEIKSLAEKQLS